MPRTHGDECRVTAPDPEECAPIDIEGFADLAKRISNRLDDLAGWQIDELEGQFRDETLEVELSLDASLAAFSTSQRGVASVTEASTETLPSVRRGLKSISTGNSLPSRRRPCSSRPPPIGRASGILSKPRRCVTWTARSASGRRISTGFPISSSRPYPNCRSIWRFV